MILPFKVFSTPLSYPMGLSLQQQVLKRPNVLLLLQHTPVYTGGRRMKAVLSTDLRLPKNAEYYPASRGGQITFHGPGQLVGYPILDLKSLKTSVRCYVNDLEGMLIRTCHDFGIEAQRSQDTGVWVQDSKIAAIGIHVTRYVTSHGFALNCDTDLTYFDRIIPCGIPNKGVTSLSKETKRILSVKDAIPFLVKNFEKQFQVNCVPLYKVDPEWDSHLNSFVTKSREP